MQETALNKLAPRGRDKETVHDVSEGAALYVVQCHCHQQYVEVPLTGFARCPSCRRRHTRKSALSGRPIRTITIGPCDETNLPPWNA